jgi:iron complex outermembrane recepter protein
MKITTTRALMLATTIISGLTFAAPAIAQTATTAEAEKTAEVVVVTGSRIARRDGTAESPILTVGTEQLAESGYTTAEQYLNTLPQITAGLSSQSNNPSSNGRAFIDLRGLSERRNLVLINGRRGMGATGGGVVDVNTIPSALVDRVEIITGGAATTYGADAVAGVVNFIMKKNFQGMAIDTQYRVTEQGDGQEFSTNVTFGGKFADDRGNAIFSAGYFKRDPMGKGDRPFAAQASGATGSFPGGSLSFGANTPTQAAVDAAFGANLCNPNGGSSGYGFNPNGTLFCTGVANNPRDIVGYTGPASDVATAFAPDFFSYNFEPDNLLVLPQERWNLYSEFNVNVNKYFKPYATAMFTNYNAKSALAPTPASGSTGFFVPVTNPFLSAQAKALAATRANPTAPIAFSKRFNALGPRASDNTFDVWQMTLGTTGTLGPILGDWTYDAYWSYGRTVLNETQDGNVRRGPVQTMLDAADGGASLCTGGLNLFGSAPISDACKALINLQAKNVTVVVQRNAEASVSGTLIELPAGPVQTVLGIGYRDLDFDFKPDSGLVPGAVAGFNEQKPVKGVLEFTDLFLETSVPILKDLPLVQSLSLTLGARRSNSNISGANTSFKVNGDWQVIDSIRLRGGYQTAVRAPNVNELFAPQLNNFPTLTNSDPCNTTGSIATTYRNGPDATLVRALCASQSPVAGGATYVQPAAQGTGITGGNPNLTVEDSKSYTVGAVYRSNATSPWLSGLDASIDYWSVNLENVIASVDATTIVQRCYNRDGANPTYSITNSWCQLYKRDANNGGIVDLLQLNLNQAFTETSGVDFTLNWKVGLDVVGLPNAGAFRFNLITTWLEKYTEQTTTVDPVYDRAGTISQVTATALPEWRSTFNATYLLGGLQLQTTSRYIGEMVHYNTVTGSSPISNTGTKATWYHDLSARYELNDNLTFRFGVNNLLDQEPRIFTPNVQANTDPSVFDVLGRRYFIGLNLKL